MWFTPWTMKEFIRTLYEEDKFSIVLVIGLIASIVYFLFFAP